MPIPHPVNPRLAACDLQPTCNLHLVPTQRRLFDRNRTRGVTIEHSVIGNALNYQFLRLALY
jgi:hypothetical protein